jgi:tRNA nucleotidyltransferase (CCA-adding enzyme)
MNLKFWGLLLKQSIKGNVFPHRMDLPKGLREIFKALRKVGAEPIVVGGSVRDSLFNWFKTTSYKHKDWDIEVYNCTPELMFEVLSKFGNAVIAGDGFVVITLTYEGEVYDFSLARSETPTKNGSGKKDFLVDYNPRIMPEEAGFRRDFRMNSIIYFDVLGGIYLDIYGGLDDIKNGTLDIIDSDKFKEDVTRVLRAMQFIARFGLKPSQALIQACKELKSCKSSIKKEMFWVEWYKLMLKGEHFPEALEFLYQTEWIDFFPEIKNLKGTEQSPKWHPEGDVLTHTGLVLNAMRNIILSHPEMTEEDKVILMFAALCHDFGKPSKTQIIDENIKSTGHCEEGVEVAEAFLKSIHAPKYVTAAVTQLVKYHLWHASFSGDEPSRKAVMKLIIALYPATLEQLRYLVQADISGRHPLPPADPLAYLLDLIKKYQVKMEAGKMVYLIKGQDLIGRGIPTGPAIGKMLKVIHKAEYDGEYDSPSSAQDWLDKYLS